MRSAMLEVTEPSFEGSIEIHADSVDTPAVIAAGLTPDGVLELIQALLTWPFRFPFEMVAKEVKSPS